MYKIKIQNHKNKKIFGIVLSVLLALLILSLITLRLLNLEIEKKNVSYSGMKTVEDVLNYYKCTYISEKNSTLEDFNVDIELKFRYELYEGEKSNETFFTNIIEDITKVLDYTNFRMIDEEKDIEIKVTCKDRKIVQILINDIEDYFIYMDSLIDISKYEEIPITDFQIESAEIQNLISNGWSSNTSFGTKDSVFEKYNEFFEEGIKTRNIDGKIYNIIFTNKYQKNVVNGLYPGMELDLIEARLGTPTFENTELNLIGYKGKEIYVFFGKDEISIYRNLPVNIDDFFELVDVFLKDELDLLDFMNELTYIWPDYSEYNYDKSHVFISYPLKGIDIQIGYDATDGIILYNNINEETNTLKKYLENTEFISKMKLDNVFEAEKRRVESKNSLKQKCNEFIESKTEKEKEVLGKSNEFDIYAELDDNEKIMGIKFISKNSNYPNREITDRIDYYLWFNDYILLYSQSKKGIFYIDLRTGQKQILLEGEDNFKLKSFENGVLKYDDKEVNIQF